MNKIALFFLVTSLSIATTPVWAGNGVIPPKPNITLDRDTNKLNNNPQEEKPEEKRSWFTAKNVGIAVVVILVATTLISKLGNDNKSSNKKTK